jgi:3D (Asp-Asp-Asp) domain-containing protein
MKKYASMFKKNRRQILRSAAVFVPMILVISMMCITVFARNTYVITDGDQVIVHTTYSTNPKEVLSEAGFSLEEADSYTTDATEGADIAINVLRAQNIKLNNCGEAVELISYGETLEALLNRSGIVLYEDYVVSLPLDTETFDGMEVSVDHVVEKQESYTKEIPYEVITVDDPNLPAGEEKILATGAAGQMLHEDSVIYCNAAEQNRTNLRQTVLEQPVNQIVARGTGKGGNPDMPLIGDGVIVLPTGEILTYYSARTFSATAYTKTDAGCDDYTATGTRVHKGVVAVDPTVVPYGTRMFIVTRDGSYVYGLSTAEDCGGGIKGTHLDLYHDTYAECMQFGVRNCTVYFLGDANWRE